MEKLIPIINKLQDVFTTVGSQPIGLPQIVVVGSQSVGKSSVLEAIVGRDFLPRGNDIVTRRPLILQLHHTKEKLRVRIRQPVSSKREDLATDSSSAAAHRELSDRCMVASAMDASARDPLGAEPGATVPMAKRSTIEKVVEYNEWGEFLHLRGRKFTDFKLIRREIEEQTEKVAPGKCISAEPINLKIYSPNVLNLTLVDLPGITKVPIGGQPHDIEERILKLVRDFVMRPRCLILAVSTATCDLATSDAMQLARKVDPKGLRTLGVLTKLDLMDAGTDGYDVLNNEVYPLQLGYVGVVNRSQKDINDRKGISEARVSEERFFKSHAVYRTIASRCGTGFLSKTLNKILMNHIRKNLPGLKHQIDENIINLKAELELYGAPLMFADTSDLESKEHLSSSHLSSAYGYPAVSAAQTAPTMVLHLISRFSDNFTRAIDGSGAVSMQRQASLAGRPSSTRLLAASQRSHGAGDGFGFEGVQSSPGRRVAMAMSSASRELFGGARILYIFRTEFQHSLGKLRAFDGLPDEFIVNSIRNASGIRSSLFIPEMCFENLVKLQIEKLRQPSLNCLEMVFEEMKRLSSQCQTPEIARFPRFRTALNDCVVNLLKRLLRPAQVFVNSLIDIELAYINKNHPDFIQMQDAFAAVRRSTEAAAAARSSASGSHHGGRSRDSTRAHGLTSRASVRSKSPPSSALLKAAITSMKAGHSSESSDKHAAHSSGFFSIFGGGSSKHSSQETESGAVAKHSSAVAAAASASPASATGSGEHSRRRDLASASSSSMRGGGDPHFHGLGLPAHLETRLSSREKQELLVIKQFIKSYFEIVKQKVADTVPKSTMCFLVNSARKQMQTELAVALYKSDKETKALLAENPEIAQKRAAANELLDVMLKALEIIDEVRDFNFTRATAAASVTSSG